MEAILKYEKSAEDDYYEILGCDETSSVEQILAEFKARAIQVHPDKNPNDAAAEERFKKLQLAKDVLTDSDGRKLYDRWRRSGVAVPFEKWSGMGQNVQTSLHWAVRKKKELMLEEGSSSEVPSEGQTGRGPSSSTTSHPPGAKGTVASGTGGGKLSAPSSDRRRQSENWEREPPGEMLRKFRNYEI